MRTSDVDNAFRIVALLRREVLGWRGLCRLRWWGWNVGRLGLWGRGVMRGGRWRIIQQIKAVVTTINATKNQK